MRLLSLIGSVFVGVLSTFSWTLAKPLLLEGDLDGWSKVVVTGETQYEPMMDIEQGVIIRAESVNSASYLQRNQGIDLTKTPIVQWQWTAEMLPYFYAMSDEGIEQKVSRFDETQSAGNDFALRLMVGVNPMFGDPKALHYVWSANQAIGETWSIDEHNKVMVVSGEDQTTMKWQTLARHVQKDWYNAFGEHIDELDFVAIMTDSDGIKGHAIGYYGDIRMLVGKALAAK